MKIFPTLTLLEIVAIDTLGDLVTTPRNIKYLLVTSGRFSKLVRTVPLRAATAERVAKALVSHWVMAYGPPRMLLFNNGK